MKIICLQLSSCLLKDDSSLLSLLVYLVFTKFYRNSFFFGPRIAFCLLLKTLGLKSLYFTLLTRNAGILNYFISILHFANLTTSQKTLLCDIHRVHTHVTPYTAVRQLSISHSSGYVIFRMCLFAVYVFSAKQPTTSHTCTKQLTQM